MFINNQIGIGNNDLQNGKDLEYYLELTKDFKSSLPPFKVKNIDGFNIMDESVSCPVGYKARSGEFLIQKLKSEGFTEVVYVQPRQGFAGISLSWLCKKYDMNLTLVMPSSKQVSDHQALCIEYGAKPLFLRIASMPNANRAAKLYAEGGSHRAYVPLGLNHEYVVAGGVRAFHDFFKGKEHPNFMWCVISTGVLLRTMQIALPDTNFKAIAVSRNIQQGELGKAKFYSYHKPFLAKSDVIPTKFNCEPCYDSKGYDIMTKEGNEGDWFFSVAGDAPVPTIDKTKINSFREWGDHFDFDVEGIKI